MAKYQQYAEYKDSGYFHLGEIPKDWKILKLKHLTRCLDGQRIPLNAIERGEKKGNIPYWGANKIVDYVDDWIFYEQLILLGEDGAPFFDPNKDVAFLVNGKIWPNNHVHVLRPFKKLVNPTFLTYAINCTDFSLYISGSTRDKLNQSDMDNICIRYCSQAEQTQIANFLDYETAKIDSLIEKQQQLIQLLKEKRQAVISHAVTKGLNPNVPMKDSGVEWLGEVPEHWTVSKLKYFASIQGGFAFSSDLFIEEGTQVLRIGNVYQNSLSLDRQPIFIASDLVKNFQDFIVKKDDVLMSLTGTLGKRDYGFAIKVETDDQYLLNQRVAKISPNKKIDTDFMVYVLWSESYLTQLYSLPSGTKQANLSNSDVLGIEIVIPPTMEEQKDIARYIKEKLAKFDEMILKAESAIQLMQERRTALISSAVTGKIDVRNWQNPTEARTEFSA